MKPDLKWILDWRIGTNPAREESVGGQLLTVFSAFWEAERLGDKSVTTQRRYSAGLRALGGYLVEMAVVEEEQGFTTEELLREHLGPDDAPLIYQDDETWQSELDTVGRKLHRFLFGSQSASGLNDRGSHSR